MSKRRPPSDDEAARPELGGPGASPAGETSPVANFESQLARLEQIVADLETGDLGLEEALGRFEAPAEPKPTAGLYQGAFSTMP